MITINNVLFILNLILVANGCTTVVVFTPQLYEKKRTVVKLKYVYNLYFSYIYIKSVIYQ